MFEKEILAIQETEETRKENLIMIANGINEMLFSLRKNGVYIKENYGTDFIREVLWDDEGKALYFKVE